MARWTIVREIERRGFGINFFEGDFNQILRILLIPPEKGAPFQLVVTANVDHLVNLSRHEGFREAYSGAWMVTVDGTPVHLYLKLMCRRSVSRVTGADLLPAILSEASKGCVRPFFVCSSAATADGLERHCLRLGFSPESIAFVVPPFGFEDDIEYSEYLLNRISLSETTHLFFGVGSPKSELWMYKNRFRLLGLRGFGFGAGLDFLAGTARRAPIPFRRLGIEWVWRFVSEPRRLAKRYFIGGLIFARILVEDLFSVNTKTLL